MKNAKLEANIWKLYLIKAVRCFILTVPIIVLFFKSNGLSMKQIFLLQSLFSVAVIFLEVPTGFYSDKFGRKKSILIGAILASAGFAVYSLSHGFFGFLTAELILGVGMSFISGSDTALMYDTLLQEGRENENKKVSGLSLSIGLFSEGIASVIGGLLATISLRFPLYCDAVVPLLVIPIAFSLVEPKRKKLEAHENSLKMMYRLMKYSLNDHVGIKWLIICSAVAGASTLTMFWLIQAYLLATKVPVSLFGVIMTTLLFTASFFSWKAHSVEKFLGKKISLAILVVFPAVGYLLLSSIWYVWSCVFILLFYVVRGLNNTITEDYINGLVSSEVRATILSVKNLVGRIMFSLAGPFVGWVNDAFSLQVALRVSGVIFFSFGLLSFWFMRRHKYL